MFRRKVRLIGDEMLHRYGACRDRWSARRVCLERGAPHRGGQRRGMDRGPGVAASRLRNL